MDHAEPMLPLRLLRLVSASLPVGAFAYSRGLETAVRSGWIETPEDVRAWIFGVLESAFSALDAPLFLKMMRALAEKRAEDFHALDLWLSAGRESRELLLEDRRMAESLATLNTALGAPPPDRSCLTLPAAFARVAHGLDVEPETALAGLMWSACDAQVAAAIRLGAIGQTDGQRILAAAPAVIIACVAKARAVRDDEIGAVCIMQALGSAAHETQYSRLFRS